MRSWMVIDLMQTNEWVLCKLEHHSAALQIPSRRVGSYVSVTNESLG